ncbi:MAG: threonine-phosphate decarboxylase CobD [Desulfobacterales bacterium]|jgi:threonine-phosphate decarboxylase
MILGHGGNVFALAERLGCSPDDIFDMSSNVNPLGPPPGLAPFLSENLHLVARLPEADAGRIVDAFSRFYGVPRSRIVAGNGTTQLIYQLPRALGTRRALIVGPTYSDYESACRMEGIDSRYHPAREENEFAVDAAQVATAAETADTVFVCNPNNPTGRLIDPDRLRHLCRELSGKRVVVDESYLPFVPNGEELSLMGSPPDNALVLHSMSKIFRIPGLRIGFAVAEDDLIAPLRRLAMPWSVNGLAQAAVAYLLERPESSRAFIQTSRRRLAEEMSRMVSSLSRSVPTLRLFPTVTSFVLIKLPAPWTADAVCETMAQSGILIRNCHNFNGLSDRFVRLSVQSPDVNRRAIDMLTRLLSGEPSPC